MPYRAKRPCNYTGCPELVDKGYCPAHQKPLNKRDKDLKKHYGRRWEKIRDLYISQHPLCEICKDKGRLTPATEVHHRVPIDQGGTDKGGNLQGLCKSCHSRLTIKATRDKGFL
jgi:5-methylcytosine-specific restriction protein A